MTHRIGFRQQQFKEGDPSNDDHTTLPRGRVEGPSSKKTRKVTTITTTGSVIHIDCSNSAAQPKNGSEGLASFRRFTPWREMVGCVQNCHFVLGVKGSFHFPHAQRVNGTSQRNCSCPKVACFLLRWGEIVQLAKRGLQGKHLFQLIFFQAY